MGGNNSTLNPMGVNEFPERIRPLLQRKLEEFKRRRNNNNGGGHLKRAISKKQLLKEDDTGAPEEGGNQPLARGEKLSKVVPLPVSECGQEKMKERVEFKLEIMGNCTKPQTENKRDRGYDDEDEDDDDEDEDEVEFGRQVGLGSPSFKIYYLESEKKKEHDDDDDEETVETVPIMHHHKTRSCDSAESAASGNSNEFQPVEIEPTIPKKKANRRKKFTAMRKNLLNLQLRQKLNPMFSCAGGGSDRKGLLNSPN